MEPLIRILWPHVVVVVIVVVNITCCFF